MIPPLKSDLILLIKSFYSPYTSVTIHYKNRLTITGSFIRWIAMIMISGITLLTMIACKSLGGAEAFPRLRMTLRGLSVAFTWRTASAIYRIAPVTRNATLAMRASGQILTSLAFAAISHAGRVAVTLTSRASGEMPPLWRTSA